MSDGTLALPFRRYTSRSPGSTPVSVPTTRSTATRPEKPKIARTALPPPLGSPRPRDLGGRPTRAEIPSRTALYQARVACHAPHSRKNGRNPVERAWKRPSSVVRKGPLTRYFRWWRGQDLNLRPSGYEPDELPDCSTPRRAGNPTVAPLLAPTRMSVAGRPGGTPLGLVSVATRRGSRPRAGRRGRRRPAWPPSCRSAGERGWGCSGRRSGRPCAGPRPR